MNSIRFTAAATCLLAACSTMTPAPTGSSAPSGSIAQSGSQASSGRQDITIRFAGEVNGQPFECGKSYAAVGTTRSTITPSDFRMYVSEVRLLRRDGTAVALDLNQDGVWQYRDVALIDFENGSGSCRNGTAPTNTAIRGTAPAGAYSGVELTVGVPFALNHQDPTIAPSPMNSTAMFWNWQGGYKFVKFDTASTGISPQKPAAANVVGPVTGYSVHLGSTACAAATRTQAPKSCQNPNRVVVRLDRFDAASGVIVADIGAVLAQANVDINAPGSAAGCMSAPDDADCPSILQAFGLVPNTTQRFLRPR